MIYTLYPDSIDQQKIQECVTRLIAGEIAIIPTDSVYAVVGDFMNANALKKLADIKKESVKEAEFSFLFTNLKILSKRQS